MPFSLYLSITTRAVINQRIQCAVLLLYRPLKFKAAFVAKMLRDLSPSVLNSYSK